MDFPDLGARLVNWASSNSWQLAVTATLLVIYFLLDRLAAPRIAGGAEESRLKSDSITKAVRTARVIVAIFGLLILTIVWGFDLGSLMIFATTAITLLGVALFASWSILSNVTAYFILLLHPSYKRGNFIRVFEADNYVEGYISDVMLFSTRLVTEQREVVVYPNNLILGRPALVNPRDRLQGVGKMTPPAPPAPAAAPAAKAAPKEVPKETPAAT
ncbi:MAG: mechanosensitive ion channel family protein [Halieaceae bacterium]|jgi:small-conductance mechanosensitive channel|nr:mechanosensitive ion channel family protein [Halieaceae bacterium]